MTRGGRRYSVAQSALLAEAGKLACIGGDALCVNTLRQVAIDHGVQFVAFDYNVSDIVIRSHGVILHAVVNADVIIDLNHLIKVLMECGVLLMSIEGVNRNIDVALSLHCARNYTVRECAEFNETILLATIKI